MNDTFATWINQQLEARDWSQRELARRAEMSSTSVSAVVSGQRLPTYEFAAAIARAFGIPPDDVFRIAGLLPPAPASETDPTLRELWNVVQDMPPDDQADVLDYARFKRLKRKK